MQPARDNPTSNGAALGLVMTTVVTASLVTPGMFLTDAAQALFSTKLALKSGMGAAQSLLLQAIFRPTMSRHALAGTLYGLLVQSLSAAAWPTALMLTTKRQILNLIYFIPALALLWLHLPDAVQVRSGAHPLDGTVAIVADNATANMPRPRNRTGEVRP